MKLTQKLNVPATVVYENILASITYDITEHTGKSVAPESLTGFKYEKKIGGRYHAEIEIIKLQPNASYHFITKTEKDTYTTHYEIEVLNEDTCQVHYFESISSHLAFQNLNHRLVAPIYGYLKKKQIKQMLQGIELKGE